MESAPLTLAYTHARNALHETRRADTEGATDEHEFAAEQYAEAFKGTRDPEALRTLRLLEQHHNRLAQILKFREHAPSAAQKVESSPVGPSQSPSVAQASDPPEPAAPRTSSPDTAQQPPRLPAQSRAPPRDVKSSIASNLASARGIPAGQQRRGTPASPTLSAQHAGGTFGKVKAGETDSTPNQRRNLSTGEKAGRDTVQRQLGSPSVLQGVPQESDELRAATTEESFSRVRDDAFQRFYSTFEGLMSKISAPLAFPGLPLSIPTSESPARAQPAEKKVLDTKAVSHAEPDLNHLFSRAALRSVAGSGEPNPAESFFLVPTTGGTVSYAQILARAEQEAAGRNNLHRRHPSANSDNEIDDFVDARETPGSLELQRATSSSHHSSSNKRRDSTVAAKTSKQQKTVEELQIENLTLKDLLDRTSNRLQMWEVNAQSSSAALQQSLRSVHGPRSQSPASRVPHAPATNAGDTPPPVPPSATPAPTEQQQQAVDQARLLELEELVRRGEAELKKTARENEKLKEVVGRYRDKWEKLKEAAKNRRESSKPEGAE